jgi:hypothetical protein
VLDPSRTASRVGGERGRRGDPGSPEHAARAIAGEPSFSDEKGGSKIPKRRGFGRSRGGSCTEIHLACDGKGRPLSVVLSSVQVSAVAAAPSLRNCLTQCGWHILSTHPVDGANALPIYSPIGVRLRKLSESAAQGRHLPHHSRAQGSQRASHRASGTPTKF